MKIIQTVECPICKGGLAICEPIDFKFVIERISCACAIEVLNKQFNYRFIDTQADGGKNDKNETRPSNDG